VIARPRDLLTELLAAFLLLTRLPAAYVGRPRVPSDIGRCVWAFPIVGLAVNALGAIVYWLAYRLGMPPLLAAAWTLAATMLATGALHEDGLADTADGFGGGATPSRKLEIMRDSHIGSYGALALLLSVVVRTAAIAALDQPHRVMLGFCAAGMLGRSGIIVLLLVVAPARNNGLGAAMGRAGVWRSTAGLVMAAVVCLVALRAEPAVAVIVAALGASLAVASLAQRQIGGHTGDVLGAGEVIAECVVLSVAASAVGV
jgi:adenosylcobinamide-GDP ribazoletransferase